MLPYDNCVCHGSGYNTFEVSRPQKKKKIKRKSKTSVGQGQNTGQGRRSTYIQYNTFEGLPKKFKCECFLMIIAYVMGQGQIMGQGQRSNIHGSGAKVKI